MHRLDSTELSYWLALEEIDPLEDSWIQSGLQVLAMAGNGKLKLGDIYPHLGKRRKKVMSGAEMALQFQILAARQNATLQGAT